MLARLPVRRVTIVRLWATAGASALRLASCRDSLNSFRQALITALGSRIVHVSSSLGYTDLLVGPSAESADEAAQVAREVLAQHDVSAHVRTERWSPREQEWRDADELSADVAAERQALHESRQERERQRSVTVGLPAWQVRVELPSHRDVVAGRASCRPGMAGPPAPQAPLRLGGLRRRR